MNLYPAKRVQPLSLKVLLLDDEESILFAMSEYLRLYGCEVDCAREMEEAQALLAYVNYSAVIADLRLTGSYGAEGLQIISDVRQKYPDTKIILLTAYGSKEIEAEAWQRGVDAVLHKPRPLGEIVHIVLALLGDRNAKPVFA